MKRILFFAALVLGMVSCMKDQSFDADLAGDGNFVVSVALPDDATRVAGGDSSKGAIANGVHNEYDIRYTLEVYDEKGALAKEAQKIEDEGDKTSTSFELRLIPGRHYRFVVWADFVKAGVEPYYNVTDLRKVQLSGEHNAMDESRDAYTAVYNTKTEGEGKEFSSASKIEMTLTRPFAKLRVVTNDMKELYADLKSATVKYTTPIYTGFNALDAEVTGATENNVEKSVDFTDAAYKYDGEPTTEGEQTLFADYIFGAEGDVVMFTLDVEDAVAAIPTVTFNTNIPVQRNYLTTIYGPVLTDANNISVEIKDAFEGNIDNDIENGVMSKTVNTAADFAETIANANINVIVLNEDINLDELTTRAAEEVSYLVAAGKNLTIDLNNHKLSATSVLTGKNYNMFDVRGTLTVKNGTMEYKHVGEDMGWNNSTNLFNITAGGVLNLEGVTAKNMGGSSMAYVAHLNNWGEATLNVKESTLESTYIAVRAFNSGNDMNNVSIYDSTLKGKYCFWVHNYKAAGDSVGTDATLNIDIFNGTNTFEYTGLAPVLYGFNNPLYFTENGTQIYYDAETLAAALTADKENIAVVLGADIDLPISSLGQITGGSGEYKLGSENTKTISIDLNNNKLNITTTYWSNLGAKNADALFTIKNGTMTSSQATGTWNSYDLCFSNCNYAFENVAFEKAIALESAGKNFNLKNISIAETHDYYAMWISAKGQNVTIDGLTVESAGRGIKIDEQYVNAPAKVTLNIDNATFKTEKKAAIVVKSVAGAEINVESINIAEVAADANFAVWVDADSANYANLVVVNGAYVKVEGSNATIVNGIEELNTALANTEVDTIILAAGEYGTIVAKSNKAIVGTENAKVDAVNLNGADYVTLKNINFDAAKAVPCVDGQGTYKVYANIMTGVWQEAQSKKGAHNLVIDGCAFVGSFKTGKPGSAIALTDYYRTSGFSGNVTIKNCVFETSTDFGGYDIYGHYTGDSTNGHGNFVIENNTFSSTRPNGQPVYLGRYASNIPVVVNGNAFNTVSSLDDAVYVQDHSNYGVSINASNNTFAN